jgi:hypothetical protein
MANITNVKIKTPLVSYASDRTEAQGLADMQSTFNKSGKEIRDVADIHDVNLALAFSVAVVENGGNTGRSQDGLSYGAMQTNAATLDGVIKFAFDEEFPFNKFFYIYYKCPNAFTLKKGVKIPKMADLWDRDNLQFRQKSVKDLMTYKGAVEGGIYLVYDPKFPKKNDSAKPENKYNQLMMTDKLFGLHIGMMYLSQLISLSVVAEGSINRIRVDWVINGYNGGFYKNGNPWRVSSMAKYTPDEYLTLPTELVAPVTKTYVKRICGVGGYLELIKLRKFTF